MPISGLQPIEPGGESLQLPRPAPAWPRRSLEMMGQAARVVGRAIALVSDRVFGALSLVIALAVLASIPVLQLAALGYLLEGSASVARTGAIRRGLVGVRAATTIGRTALGLVLASMPMWLMASFARSAELIDPAGPVARGWRIAFGLTLVLSAGHLAIASIRGGGLRPYLWPVGSVRWLLGSRNRGEGYRSARDSLWEFAGSLRLKRTFVVGFCGFIGGLVWLGLPASLLAAGRKAPGLGLLGGAMLVLVVPLIPFLQVQFAVDGTIRSLFRVRGVRSQFARAPLAFAFATGAVLLAAIPLNLFKIEQIPREAVWLPGLFFVLFMAPGRLLIGWAYHRASIREVPRGWLARLVGRVFILAMATLYVLSVFLAQYTAWDGVKSLYEQHAFLLPVAF